MLPIIPTSFGDIVTAASLALAIYNALRDSTGASYDYQSLLDEMHSFERTLRYVHVIIAMIPPSSLIAQDIKCEMTGCITLLKGFHDRIKSYQKKLGGGSKGSSWKKVGWALFKTNEVLAFRQKLAQRKLNITLFLNGLSIILSAPYNDDCRKRYETIHAEVLAIPEMQLPRSIEYGDVNSVTLINAFGERNVFPWEYCFSQEMMHKTLKTYFKGKYGQGQVERHAYRITTTDGKSPIDYSNWDSFVKKGAVVVMSMVLSNHVKHEEYLAKKDTTCPRCGETDIGTMQDGGWQQCRHCERRYTKMDSPVSILVPYGMVTEFRNILIAPQRRQKCSLGTSHDSTGSDSASPSSANIQDGRGKH